MPDSPTEREAHNDALIRSFIDTFERPTRHFGPVLHRRHRVRELRRPRTPGQPEPRNLWAGVFRNFSVVRFETVNQAVDGDVVIAEQIHGLGLPGKPLAAIKNLAVYEIRDGKIAAWRDYTNPTKAAELLGL